MIYAQAFGALSVGLLVALDRHVIEYFDADLASAWIAAGGAGCVGLLATVALYRGFQVGRIAIVSPIAAAYGAVTASLAHLTGEPLAPRVMFGIGLVTMGVVLASGPARPALGESVDRESGISWAIAACVGYGVQFWIEGRWAVPKLGSILPVGIYYAVSTALLLAAALVRRSSLQLSSSEARVVLGTGAVAVLGFLSLSAGLATGQVAVVTVIGSLQCPVTIGLAWLLLKETLTFKQWCGIVAVVAGLTLIRV